MNRPKYSYNLNLAGISLPALFCCPDTAAYFREYCVSSQQENNALFLTEEDWAWGMKYGLDKSAFSEYSLFTGTASEALLNHGRCILHGVALSREGRAWLITAPSGVGKSTQAKTLQELHPGEFGIICGDRPVLRLTDDDTVMVHPSPWNGKENWHGADEAPLEGIICLQRGVRNEIQVLSPREAALVVYYSLIHNGSSVEKIENVAGFEAELLRRAPVWLLTSACVPASTELLYSELFG